MKKIIALLLTAALAAGAVAGCGETGETNPSESSVQTEQTTEAPSESALPTESSQQSTEMTEETAESAEESTEVPAESTQGTASETKETTAPLAVQEPYDYGAIDDFMTAPDGLYTVAFVADIGNLKDPTFNRSIWEGVKRYAAEAGKSYKYYSPAEGAKPSDENRYEAMRAAVEGGAQIVVCAGFQQKKALAHAAELYPEVRFVFVDGVPVTDSAENLLTNVLPVAFREEQSGYLAGYAAVMEGYTKLGFSGGGSGTNPACSRFGYGFVQGAEAAASELETAVELKFSWANGETFQPSLELQTMLEGWYSEGTEVIFVCGGRMSESAFAAAEAKNGLVIGVDTDQSAESSSVITSAMKHLREAVYGACTRYATESWGEVGGEGVVLGVEADAVGLPIESWSMKTFTSEAYLQLLQQLKDGTVEVGRDYANGLYAENFEHVTLLFV